VTVAAPPRPPRHDEPEALFEEARQHRRRRRLRAVVIAGVALAVAAAAYGVLDGRAGVFGSGGGGGSAGAVPKTRTVVLLVDVSGSMAATDVRPTRLDATVRALRMFLGRLPKDVQVGIVAFSTSAQVELEPTTDRTAAVDALGRLGPVAGTDLGDGLASATSLATDALRRDGVRVAPGHAAPAAIVLESDGAQNRGTLSPAQAALVAKKAGIRVFGVALGTPTGTVRFGNGSNAPIIGVRVPPDPATVRTIARVTHGEAFTARTAAQLGAAYGTIAAALAR
jgi:Ca-activated chloride channel family protein